jgi:hypothetical protein
MADLYCNDFNHAGILLTRYLLRIFRQHAALKVLLPADFTHPATVLSCAGNKAVMPKTDYYIVIK